MRHLQKCQVLGDLTGARLPLPASSLAPHCQVAAPQHAARADCRHDAPLGGPFVLRQHRSHRPPPLTHRDTPSGRPSSLAGVWQRLHKMLLAELPAAGVLDLSRASLTRAMCGR